MALGITCAQCTPVQLELLRRAGAMPVTSRRCGMITRREAERLCKSFLGKPPNSAARVEILEFICDRRSQPTEVARELCVRRQPLLRLGVSWCVPAIALQLLAGQVHQMLLLQPLLLAKQIHLPLSPQHSRCEIRSARRCEFQLVEETHPPHRQPTRPGGVRVGGRQGHVQRWQPKEGDQHQQRRVFERGVHQL